MIGVRRLGQGIRRIGARSAMSRQRISSVPLGAVLAALVLIAVVALFVLYLGNDTVTNSIYGDPAVELESGDH